MTDYARMRWRKPALKRTANSPMPRNTPASPSERPIRNRAQATGTGRERTDQSGNRETKSCRSFRGELRDQFRFAIPYWSGETPLVRMTQVWVDSETVRAASTTVSKSSCAICPRRYRLYDNFHCAPQFASVNSELRRGSCMPSELDPIRGATGGWT